MIVIESKSFLVCDMELMARVSWTSCFLTYTRKTPRIAWHPPIISAQSSCRFEVPARSFSQMHNTRPTRRGSTYCANNAHKSMVFGYPWRADGCSTIRTYICKLATNRRQACMQQRRSNFRLLPYLHRPILWQCSVRQSSGNVAYGGWFASMLYLGDGAATVYR
eukprot:scaffold160125_cov31-Tisochrysis_lutea.AAC.1